MGIGITGLRICVDCVCAYAGSLFIMWFLFVHVCCLWKFSPEGVDRAPRGVDRSIPVFFGQPSRYPESAPYVPGGLRGQLPFFRSLPSHATLELLHAPHSGTMGPVSLEFGCPAVQHFPNYSHRRYQGIGTRTGADPPSPHPEPTPAGRELTAPGGSFTFAPPHIDCQADE